MSTTGGSISELKERIKKDVLESHQLQTRIDQLRQDIADGNFTLGGRALPGAEIQAKRMSKDLCRRVEAIEDKPTKDATDREYLQALNARQVAWDRQIMQVAEISDLMYQARRKDSAAKPQAEAPATNPKNATSTPTKLAAPAMRSPPPTASSSPHAARSPSPPTAHTSGHVSEVQANVTEDDDEWEEAEYMPPGEDQGHDNEDEHEAEQDKSAWPLCYRILDVDPTSDFYYFEAVLKKAYRSLASKHSPEKLPNDSDAPARWAAITKAYETLNDPQRRQS